MFFLQLLHNEEKKLEKFVVKSKTNAGSVNENCKKYAFSEKNSCVLS